MVSFYNKKGRITHMEVGGHDSWVMYGPVFFSRIFPRSSCRSWSGIITPRHGTVLLGRMC